jgi:hypothetical protein
MWLVGNLDHRRSDAQPRARGKVRDAQVEVDVQLVTGQLPSSGILGDQSGAPGIHHRDLPVRVGGAVHLVPAAAPQPHVPDQAHV